MAPPLRRRGVGVIRIGGDDGLVDAEDSPARYDANPERPICCGPAAYVAARFRHPTRPALDAAVSRAAGVN